MSSTTIYRAKCQACKHEWTSRRGAGTLTIAQHAKP